MGLPLARLAVVCLALSLAMAGQIREEGRARNHGHNVCSTWGDFHYKTFDGAVFRFAGLCDYNFASDCRDSYKEFAVHLQRGPAQAGGVSQITSVLLTIKDDVIYLTHQLVVVNGAMVGTPHYSSGLLIEKNEAYTKVYSRAGLSLMWNREDSLMLELDSKFQNHTCGLCGDYNGQQTSEFLSDGISLSATEFGNRQKINNPQTKCEDPEEVSAPESCSEHRAECERLLTAAAFEDCQARLPLGLYLDACVQDLCSCGSDASCACSTISEFSRQCSHAGGRPGSWRTASLCPKSCPGNMVYLESGSPCVDTCSHLEVSSLCEEHPMDGCFCPEGTVYDDVGGSGCIPVSQCHCKLHGRLYSPGQKITNDCEDCVCNAGRWVCKDLPCPGTCALEGGSHITTFDGKKFTFHGDCYYVLSKGDHNDSHALLGELAPCGSSDKQTCLKSVVLVTDRKKDVVAFKADGRVLLNELEVHLPHVTASFSIFQPSSHHIIVDTAFGLRLQIQLVPVMQLFVTLDQASQGQVQGLCGNFNGLESDDFRTASRLVEATGAGFANTWKAQSSCHDKLDWLDDPCSLNIESANYAEHWCSLLKKTETPFSKCHSAVDPSEYYKRCKYDTCNCANNEDCLCAALSSYAHACAAKGVMLWGWRERVCNKEAASCPSSQVFLYNLTTCQQTCRSLSEANSHCLEGFAPVDGCGCPDRTFLDEKGRCVPVAKCSCYHNGLYLEAGDVVLRQEERCICRNGRLHCTQVKLLGQSCAAPKILVDCNNLTALSTLRPRPLSCQTLAASYYHTGCVSGCVCPEGLIDDGRGGCVEEENCPCLHHKDLYSPGSKIKVDCNTCTCQRGRWVCTQSLCHGTCSIYGSGHYVTFDGKYYDFDGQCSYVAVQDYCGQNSSRGSFSIITENVPCGTTGVTCSKAIKIFLGGTELKLEEKHRRVVQLAGRHVAYTTREVGQYLVVEASTGVIVIWDKKTTLFIKLAPSYKGTVCGLCGNFDDRSNNDFTTRDHLVVSSELDFGNSWKEAPTCPDVSSTPEPCSLNPHRRSWAEKQCSLIKSSVFSACHSKVDPTVFYEACVHDSCSCDTGGDCECFCSAVASYAQECTKAGACVFWRTPDLCPVFCDYYNPPDECEWHYEPCGNRSYETCRTVNGIHSNISVSYLEGCYPRCPRDRPIYDEDLRKCVREDQCGCYIEDTRYPPGASVPTDEICKTCVCTESSQVECRPEEGKVLNQTQDGAFCYEEVCGPDGTVEQHFDICTTITPTLPTQTASTTTTLTPSTPLTSTSTSTSTSTGTSTAPTSSVPCCFWTDWINEDHPSSGNDGGDRETFDAVCAAPENIECRSATEPHLSWEQLGQKVVCDISHGFICKNEDQFDTGLFELCYDYEIRVNCCVPEACTTPTKPPPTTATTTPTTTTTSPSTVPTTTPSAPPPTPTTPPTTTATTTPTTTTTSPSTVPTTTPSAPTPTPTTPPTTTATTPPTTTSTATPPTTTSSPPSPSPTPCVLECEWTGWLDSGKTDYDKEGGDVESTEGVCAPDWVVNNITCRAAMFPSMPLEELGQTVVCNLKDGLVCRNKDQKPGGRPFPMPYCLNYEINVQCCRCTPSTSTPSTTPTTTTTTTQTTTPTPTTTTLPPSTPTPTTTPTPSTTVSPTTTPSTPTPTTTTTGTPTPTPTTTTTETPTPTPTTTITQTTTTATVSPTTTTLPTTSTTPTTTPCFPECEWTGWLDSGKPDYDKEGGDVESIEGVCAPGRKVNDTSCRAAMFPSMPLEELGQTVTCNADVGLVCRNKDQKPGGRPFPMPYCLNYEINVQCCVQTCSSTTTFTTTTTTETTTTQTTTPTPGSTTPKPTTTPTPPTPTPTTTSTQTTTPTPGSTTPKPTTTPTPSTPTPTTTTSTTQTTTPTPGTTTPTVSTPTPTTTTTRNPTPAPTTTTTQTATPTPETPTPTPSTPTPTTTTTRTTTTVSPTTTTLTPTVCVQECEWSGWLDSGKPDYDKEGRDVESIEGVCAPGLEANNITCRAAMFPSMPLEELGQTVVCNLNDGLVCKNKDQKPGGRPFPMPYCLNYEINVQCCGCPPTTPSPTTTTTTQTTTPTPSTTVSPTTIPSTTTPTSTTTETPTPTPKTTTTATESPTTTPSTSTPLTTTSSPTTTTIPTISLTTPCFPGCKWSGWLDSGKPDYDKEGGDVESIEGVCAPGWVVNDTSCRAAMFPSMPLEELGQTVTCNADVGLVCRNKDQKPGGRPFPMPYCLNYEINVQCCDLICSSTTTFTTTTTTETTTPTPTTTSTQTTTPTPTTTTSTQTTTPTPETTPTPSTPTPTTTTTQTTTQTPRTTTPTVSTPTPTTTTTRNPTPAPTTTTTQTATPTPETPTPTPSTPTPTTTTTRTTTTVSPTTTTLTPTVCVQECEWSGWLDSGKPDYDKEGRDVESIEGVCAPGLEANNITCRAAMFPSMPLEELGQTVVCNLNDGLVCKNKDQKPGGRPFPMPYCLNYEINVQCCGCPPTTPSPTTTTTTQTTTPTPSTTVSPTTIPSTPTPTTTTTTQTTTPTPTTTTTTQTITPTPETSTLPPSTPIPTTTTQTTTPTSTTTTPTPPTRTPTATTTETPTPTPTTTTPTPTTTTQTPSTVSSTTTTLTPTVCVQECEWSGWLDSGKPDYDKEGGDVESIEGVCAPGWVVNDTSCRAAMFPSMPLEELGQTVVCNADVGLVCRNKDQKPGGRPFPMPYCLNYEINVQCCVQTCSSTTTFTTTTTTETSTPTPETTPTPPTTTPTTTTSTQTTTPTPTTTTTQTITPTPETSTLPPSTPTPTTTTQTTTPTSTTTTPTPPTTTPTATATETPTPTPTTTTQTTTPTPTTTTQTPSTVSPTTTALTPTECVQECKWTGWLDSGKPDYDKEGGDVESIEGVCAPGWVVNDTSCRAAMFPSMPLEELGQTVVCNADVGLVCRNKDQKPGGRPFPMPYCLNYEINVQCCVQTCSSTTTFTTTTTTETTTPTPKTTPTPSTTTPETTTTQTITPTPTTTTTQTITPTPETSTLPPSTPTPTTTTQTTTPTSTTTTPTPPTTTPTAITTETPTPTPTTTTETPNPTPTTTTPTPSTTVSRTTTPSTTTPTTTTIETQTPTPKTITTATESPTTTLSPTTSTVPSPTPCFPECEWTGWLDSGKPDYDKEGGDVESIEGVCAPDWVVNDTSCRAAMFPSMPLEELGQTVTCNADVGLVCRNKDQKPGGRPFPMPYCLNYEINVQCCDLICSSTTTFTTTTTTTPTSEITTTATESATTTPSPTTSATPSTTPCFPECKWTGWLDSGKPDYDKEGGDVESIEGVCAPGWVVNDTSCRAAMFPSMPLEELGQTVTCNADVGLVCRNKDQKPGGRPFPMPYCLNYEINVQCCVQTCSSTTFTTTTTTTETSTPTPGTTTPTPPTPTPTTTTQTTTPTPGTTSPTPGTSTPTPSPPTSTTTTTQTTTPIPGTTTSIPSTSTPSTTVSPTPTPTTMTTTTTTEIPPPPSTTTESPTITPSTTTTTTSTTTTETSTPTSPVTQTPTITTTTTTTTTESSTPAPSPTPTNTQPGSSTLPTPPSTPTPPTAPSTPTGSTLSTSTASPGTSTSGTAPTPATVPTTTRGTPTQTRPPTTPSTLETTSTSSTVTPISSPTTVFNTSLGTVSSSTLVTCCVVNDTNKLVYYAPGEEVYSGRHGDTCYYVNCSVECTLQTFNWSCPSSPSPTSTPSPSTPSSPATTTSTSTSTPTPFPPTTTTTPSPTTTTPSPSTPPSPPTTTTSTTSSPPTTTPSPTTSTPSPSTPPSTAKTTSTTTSKPTTTKPPGCQNLNPPREDNESWWLCNCTKAVCREDGTLEIVEVECEPPPMPTCSNGLKPVRVLDPDGCCWHWECDCLCTGWGDPHYVTFDGLYYSYQGNCTYVLVEEVVPTVDNFGVYIDNYHCDVNDKVSCPRTLIVRHETQEVQIRTVQMLPTKVQVQVNRQMVALPYRKFGMQVYESGINIVVDIPELGVIVSYNGLAFSVQLPYRLFGNNTKGQCGTCTNNTADDCVLPSGEVTPNCEIAADQWVVDDPSKPHCPHGGFTTQSPAATSPRAPARPKDCTGSPVCQLIKDSLFAGCHALVPPQHYYEACLYDTCSVPDSSMECASLQAYAALCAQEGFCVDWRPHSKGACPVKCPSHREYRACGPPEEPTCQSSTPKNSTRLVEGCFCPEGTMNFAPGYDVCVKTCGCVGPDNVPREFGERFEFACQDCVCLEGGSGIICEPRQCGQAGPTSCEEEGTYLTTEVNPADTCCNVTSCKCDSSLCSKEVPVCDLGFEAKLRIVSGRCCPVYDCVPKGVCVHDKAEYQPGSPVYSSKCQDCLCTHAVDNSTQLNAISCTPVPCNVSCNPGFEAVEVPGECCRKCQQTQCIIDVPGGNYLVLKPGDVQQDPNNKCTFFSCTKFHGQLISSLSNVTCPEFDPNSCAPGTITLMANGCCKKCTPRNQTVVPCAAVAVTREISHAGCRKNVTVNDCSGACGTFAKYSGKAKILDSRCSCCREERTSRRQVALDCPNGGSLTYTYTHIESCLCQDSVCEAFGRRRRSVAGLAGGL